MAASLDVLRKSLAANGLPTTGSKADLLARLLQGTPDKRRSPAKKPALAASVTAATVSPTSDGDKYEAFAAAERLNLAASGITGEEAIEEEVQRRWTVLQSLKPAAPAQPAAAETLNLPVVLDDTQMAAAKLTYVGPVEGGQHMYVRAPAVESKPESKSPAAPNKVARKTAAPKPAAAKKVDKAAAEPAKDSGSSTALGKRKAEEEPPVDEDQDQDMTWACDITSMRLINKVNKEAMVAMLKDFGVPTKGTKEELAALLAEQLHYETDDEEDDA